MIAPHTTIPTAHAAIQDPCHMVTTTFACLVIGAGMPIRVNALDWQPAVASSTAAPIAARGSQRRARRTRLASGVPPLPPALLGALRFRLTYGLPGGVTPAPRGRQLLVLQPVVETVSRSPAALPGTPAGIGRARCAALTCA